MGCDKVTLRLRVEKLQILKFCSFAANMQLLRAFHCAATFHAQIDRNSRENSQMPVKPQDVQANGMRSLTIKQNKHQQNNEKFILAMAHEDERPLNWRMGVGAA